VDWADLMAAQGAFETIKTSLGQSIVSDKPDVLVPFSRALSGPRNMFYFHSYIRTVYRESIFIVPKIYCVSDDP